MSREKNQDSGVESSALVGRGRWSARRKVSVVLEFYAARIWKHSVAAMASRLPRSPAGGMFFSPAARRV